MINLSASLKLGSFGLSCGSSAYRMWQGGNQWSAWASFLGFFRHVVKLKIDYSKYDHWEKLALHSGPRVMHPDFCMISDRPILLTVNERNQPHAYQGPFCKWSDGTELYSINGVRVPQWVAETPKDQFTKEMILSEKNVDVRREIVKKIGIDKAVEILQAKVIDKKHGYELLAVDLGDNRVRPYLKMKNPSTGAYHIEGVRPEIKTVEAALCYRNGLETYYPPEQLT